MLSQKIKQLRYCDYVEHFVNNNKPIDAFHAEIKNQLNNTNIPISKQGLLNLALQKNDSLKRYLDINLSKKQQKAIDLLCEYRFDIDGGYQGFKNKIAKAKESTIKTLQDAMALNMPSTMIIAFNPDTDYIYDISQVDVDFTIKKHSGFHDTFYHIGIEEDADTLNEYGATELSEEQFDALAMLYTLSDLYVDTGSDNNGYGLGNFNKDLTYIQDTFGLAPAKPQDCCYEAFEGNDRPLIVMVVNRPNDDVIEKCIHQIENYE